MRCDLMPKQTEKQSAVAIMGGAWCCDLMPKQTEKQSPLFLLYNL